MAEKDWVKLIEEREKEIEESGLWKRMDDDRKLVELDPYSLTDADGHNIPHSVSVTLNDPAVFAGNVEAALGGAIEQVFVETESYDVDTAEIESCIKYAFRQANDKLSRRGEFPLEPVIDQSMCRRGSEAARCLFTLKQVQDDEGKIVEVVDADIRPWDTRFVTPIMSDDGMACIGYKTTRSKDDIEAEYPPDEYSYPTVGAKGAEIRDIWATDVNIVKIGGEIILEEPHDYGRPPVAYQMVSIGSMLADIESRKRRGESIFFLIRDLIPAINQIASVAQSLTLKQLDAALTQVVGPGGTPSNYDDLTGPGNVTGTERPDAVQQVPYGDIRRSATLLHAIIEGRIQRGSLSSTDLGTLNFPLSAVALIEIGEGRDKIFLPRLGARGLLKQQLAEMFIEQIIRLGVGSIELGTRGHKRTFSVGDLKGDYQITYQYFVKSPQIDIARVSQAAAYGNLISAKSKRRDVLKLQDPDKEEALIRWEDAELMSPAIRMHRTVRQLLKLAEAGDPFAEIEAEILSAEMQVSLKQMMMGGGGQLPTVGREQNPQQPLLPMMGSGGGNPEGMSSQAKDSQLQQETAAQEA